MEEAGKLVVTRGMFIEDGLGRKCVEEVQQHGLSQHRKYGTFVVDDRHDAEEGQEDPHIRHMHGRCYWSDEQRLELGLPPRKSPHPSTPLPPSKLNPIHD